MSKRRKKTQADDLDYRAAWKACGAPLAPRVWGDDTAEIDLRSRLDDLLKSGWPMKALYSYASTWRPARYDHVTPSVWRWGIYFAKADLCGEAMRFLKDWNARQEELNDQIVTPA